MDFRASPSKGGWIGLGLLAGLGALEAWVITLMRESGPTPGSALLGLLAVVLLVLFVLMAYWTWGYFNLRYRLSRDGLHFATEPGGELRLQEVPRGPASGRCYEANAPRPQS